MSERDEAFFDDEPEEEAAPAPKPKKKKKAKRAKVVVEEYDPEVAFDSMYRRHMQARGMSGPYPTEEPDDPNTLWSPRPGIFGCKKIGYQKIK